MKWLEWILRPTHFFFIALLGPLVLALMAALIAFIVLRLKRRSPGGQKRP
ncbi:MAG TPA: hypothetical protein VG204_17375 [Terriglobia bacterium]|nr:hypothetical protein [Terriglobia bacterium]